MAKNMVSSFLMLLALTGSVNSQLTTSQLQMFESNNVTITNDTTEPDKYWIFNHHGIPSHDYGPFPSVDNPNSVSAQNHMFKIPKNPVVATTPGCLMLGDMAVAVNGVPLYNPYSGFGYNAVEGSNREIFDNCTGHPQPQGAYHYHTIPECLYTGQIDQLIGVALDGYPIYGAKTTGGAILKTADLDACHGRTVNGQYEYRLTADFPYIMGCYHGQGPPPQGGQQPPAGGGGSNTGSFGPQTCLYATFCENPALGCPCAAYTYDANADRTSTTLCNTTQSGSMPTVREINLWSILFVQMGLVVVRNYLNM